MLNKSKHITLNKIEECKGLQEAIEDIKDGKIRYIGDLNKYDLNDREKETCVQILSEVLRTDYLSFRSTSGLPLNWANYTYKIV